MRRLVTVRAYPARLMLVAGLMVARAPVPEAPVLAMPSQRERILQIVTETPGLPVGALLGQTQIGWGTLYYHLAKMAKAGQIHVVRIGRRRLVYPATGGKAAELARGDAIMRGRTARLIAEIIYARPGLSIQDIVDEAGYSQRVVYYHVRRLIEADLVVSSSATRHRNLSPTQRLRAVLNAVAATPPTDP